MPVSLSPKESKKINSFWSEHYWSWSKYNWLLTPPQKKKRAGIQDEFRWAKSCYIKRVLGLGMLEDNSPQDLTALKQMTNIDLLISTRKGSRSFNLSCFGLLLHRISPVNFLVQSSTKGPTPSSFNAIEWDPQLPGTFIPVTLSSCRNILRNEAHRREIKETTKRWLSSHIFTVKNLNNCWF